MRSQSSLLKQWLNRKFLGRTVASTEEIVEAGLETSTVYKRFAVEVPYYHQDYIDPVRFLMSMASSYDTMFTYEKVYDLDAFYCK